MPDTSPNMYTVAPPIGGMNTSKSERVTSSGNMPAVCSNRVRRRSASSQPKRAATPGKYQTGSSAAFTTHHRTARLEHVAIDLEPSGRDRFFQLWQLNVRARHGHRRADVVALFEVGLEHLTHERAERVERDDLGRIEPAGKWADHVGGRGIGQIRFAQRVERARGHRHGAVHRVAARVRTDHVALRSVGHGADQRPRAASDLVRPKPRVRASAPAHPGAR